MTSAFTACEPSSQAEPKVRKRFISAQDHLIASGLGIGRATAIALAELGADVVAVGRSGFETLQVLPYCLSTPEPVDLWFSTATLPGSPAISATSRPRRLRLVTLVTLICWSTMLASRTWRPFWSMTWTSFKGVTRMALRDVLGLQSACSCLNPLLYGLSLEEATDRVADVELWT